ncbi:ATP-binding protein [Neoroseomonas rubea]|uniref:ATP-binding protein n=1 Tax=Neoroseomonas rubea TaxID=2748666 RepID=UPI0018DFD5C4|nr:ATP-binding protein [Roseomonas rubea]
MSQAAGIACEGPRAAEEVPALLDRAEALLAEAGCATPARMQVLLVLEEVVTNILRNAWPGGTGQGRVFTLALQAAPAGEAVEVAIETEDDGIAFDPTAAAPADVDAALEDRAIGGLGLHFMREMTDRQSYARIGGRNRLRLERRCPAGA